MLLGCSNVSQSQKSPKYVDTEDRDWWRMTTRFQPVGKYGEMELPESSRSSAKDIEVFYRTAPSGFRRSDGGIRVSEQLGHRILGEVSVVARSFRKANCHPPVRDDAIETLRREAYERGGDIVIYANSLLPEEQSSATCAKIRSEAVVASGWAIQLAEDSRNRGPETEEVRFTP